MGGLDSLGALGRLVVGGPPLGIIDVLLVVDILIFLKRTDKLN
jgi:hypothetical protein